MLNSICTGSCLDEAARNLSCFAVYELQTGAATKGAEFHGLDLDVLMIALRLLSRQGKATLVSGETLSETGVKFHDVR